MAESRQFHFHILLPRRKPNKEEKKVTPIIFVMSVNNSFMDEKLLIF